MLTNAAAKAAGAQSRAYKLHDQGGLFLHVATTGTKTWRQKYRWRGREKLLVHGRYPEMNLAQARMRTLEAKDLLGRGVDPARPVDLKVNTFEQLARAWYRHNFASWSPAHAADVIGSLERDVFPELAELGPDAIAAPRLLKVLRAVEQRGNVATAQRLRQRLSEVFRYGKAEGLAESDPAEALGAAMLEAPPATPHPALTIVGECRELLLACDRVEARPSTRLASRFLALTAVRLDSVRGLRWCELALRPSTSSGPQDGRIEEALWRVPPARLKLKRSKKDEARFEHLVPLSIAAIAVLREAALCIGYDPQGGLSLAEWASTKHNDLVFPGRDPARPIGEGAIGELYQRAALRLAQDGRPIGKHVPHGWRSSFSTILNELLGESWSVTIDRALAHSPKDKVEAAYNRAQLLDRRRELFDRWGELLAG